MPQKATPLEMLDAYRLDMFGPEQKSMTKLSRMFSGSEGTLPYFA